MEKPRYFIDDTAEVRNPRLRVIKSARALEVYDGARLAARIRAATGRGSGPKLARGDLKTPEGFYYTCVRNDKSQFHLSIGISYPNAADALRGLAAGIITQQQHDAVVAAERLRARPPWDTGLGGEIMIHGGGSDRDWTAGCVALDDDAVDFLWKFIENGTTVEILP